jgi:oligopeptide/dipeptide ABC transporter ATP-binding protein
MVTDATSPRVVIPDLSKPTETILDVRHLSVTYASQARRVYAVDDVSFSLERGEAIGVVGESGCGKSTVALALLGLLPKNAVVTGSVTLAGVDLLKLDNRRLRRIRGKEVAIIFQDPMTSLNPVMTVGQQLVEGLRIHLRLSRQDARKRALELLELVQIPRAAERFSAYPHQLSGGLRQRVMIAIAVGCRPKVLVADEPTTALDVTVQAQILDLLFELGQELGMAIVLVSHDLGVIGNAVDRVLVMYAGHIVESGPTMSVLRKPGHPYTSALLDAMVTLEGERQTELKAIPGSPPALSALARSCPFAERCEYVLPDCLAERPLLRDFASGRSIACVRAGEGFALRRNGSNASGGAIYSG